MKLFKLLWVILAAMFLASVPMFAQTAATAPANGWDPARWKLPIAGFAMAIASGLCGLGQGKAVASAAEGVARNPGATAAIRGVLILGLVLIESLALYTLVIIFVVGPIS
jgi:F-type H+-transporting ATPase subunit c